MKSKNELKSILPISLDIESTGLIPQEHHILQIALVVGLQDYICYDCGVTTLEWNAAQSEALKVNKWTEDRALHGHHRYDVDDLLVQWIQEHEALHSEIRAVGWNVGSFDLQLMRYDLPKTFALFSHRSIDLNSICSISSNPEWKGKSKNWARKVLGKVNMHDALWDAQEALLSFYFLKERFMLV